MLGIGEKFPSFSLKAVVSTDSNPEKSIKDITDLDYSEKWKVYFFWPADFTSLCPTEIAGFGKLNKQFHERDAQILGGSTDSEWVHRAWRSDHADLRDLPFPMLADGGHDLCGQLGILAPNGMARRAAYIVDPEGIIRFVYVTDGAVGRNPEEVLRVLDALQADKLCPCNWKKGEATL
jgi:peroxiredoxin (alkyl hydroperoxide reductase subunit C)